MKTIYVIKMGTQYFKFDFDVCAVLTPTLDKAAKYSSIEAAHNTCLTLHKKYGYDNCKITKI